MADIDKIVAEMPKAEQNGYEIIDADHRCICDYTCYFDVGFEYGTKAQCRLLVEAGYRKVKNKEKMVAILWEFMKTSENRHTIEEDADFIIEKLLERDNE